MCEQTSSFLPAFAEGNIKIDREIICSHQCISNEAILPSYKQALTIINIRESLQRGRKTLSLLLREIDGYRAAFARDQLFEWVQVFHLSMPRHT